MNGATLRRPTGQTNLARQKAAAGSLIAGAVAMVVTTLAGVAPPQNLLIFGLIVVLAWLVDGSTRRYVGPGLAATAVGAGLTLGSVWGIEPVPAEHILVYTFIGLALLAMSYIDVENVRGGAFLLIFIGASAANQNFGVSFNLGWEFVAILGIWGAVALTSANREERELAARAPSARAEAPPADDRSLPPVGAGSR